MTYTIKSAQWGNEQATSAVVLTEEVGHVAISDVDTPEEWASFQAWAAHNPITPMPLPPPPQVVSDRQFFQQLAVLGIITQVEALAAVKTGDVPATLQALVDALPDADKFSAEMLISGAVEFKRNHPLVTLIGNALNWTTDQIDQLWIDASQL